MSYKEKYLKLKRKYIQIKKIQLIGSSMSQNNSYELLSLTPEQKNNPDILLTALKTYNYALVDPNPPSPRIVLFIFSILLSFNS